MREKYRDIPPLGLEERADASLATGAFADAEAYLTELLRTHPNADKYHHLLLKQTALPLYEMGFGVHESGDAEVIYDEANEIYGLVGRLLQYELYTFSHAFHQEIGRISELTFFALHLRQLFSDETEAVMLPAPAVDDRKGVDFYKSPVGTRKITDGQGYQIKTQATPEVREQYAHSSTVLISMNDIDKYAAEPRHPKSLPRTILRELGLPLIGSDQINPTNLSAKSDKDRLDRAVTRIEEMTSRTATETTTRALTKSSLLAIEMDDVA